ncbi:MAG TPA: T9SS type A sorting domain-containing protein [Bacteroidales bacterium]|nr:T9SS type A sorting domain-containing protein [Bacteroidales bacterium]
MRTIKYLITIFFFLIAIINETSAQNAIIASGGNASGSGGSIENSIGLIFYTVQQGSNGSVSAGVQQPFEISVVLTTDETNYADLLSSLTVFPNPTNNNLILRVGNSLLDDLNFFLYDMSGKLLKSEKVVGNETYINISNYVNSIYFLKIIENSKEIKTFKIIKNN